MPLTEQGLLAVNGMSYQARDGENANSALIVTVTPKDFPEEGALGGIAFQRDLKKKPGNLERERFRYSFWVPASAKQPTGRDSSTKHQRRLCSDRRAFHSKELGDSIEEGIFAFGKKLSGFDRKDAVLSGIESRTSSPVRLVDQKGLSNITGIYPCGEDGI